MIGKLLKAEVLRTKGMSMTGVMRQLGVSGASYYKKDFPFRRSSFGRRTPSDRD